MKFVDHVFDDQVIDHMTLKIILPEGSTYVTSRVCVTDIIQTSPVF